MGLTAVWPTPDQATQYAVKAFWKELGIAGSDADADARATKICVVGRIGGKVVATSSVDVGRLEGLRQNFALLRWIIAPAHHSGPAFTALARAAHDHLEAWSLSNPERRVMGMAMLIGPAMLPLLRKAPVWAMRPGDELASGLVLAGYTEANEQLRVAWFRHARLEVEDAATGDSGAAPGEVGANPAPETPAG